MHFRYICLVYIPSIYLENIFEINYIFINLNTIMPSMVASAGETDRDLAATQFTKNGVACNIIEF